MDIIVLPFANFKHPQRHGIHQWHRTTTFWASQGEEKPPKSRSFPKQKMPQLSLVTYCTQGRPFES